MKKALFTLVCLFFFSGYILAQKRITLNSPNGNITFTMTVERNALPCYDVSYKHTPLIQKGNLGFEFEDGIFGEDVTVKSVKKRSGVEKYDLVVGKCSHVEEAFKEVVVSLVEDHSPFRQVNVVVRSFNDGVAFRYEFPTQEHWNRYVMYDELTSFNLAGDPEVLTMFLASYTTSHEGFYSHMRYADLPTEKLMDMPTLYQYDDVYMAVTEAAVRDYAGMYLMKEQGTLKGKLSPLPGQETVKVVAEIPHHSPWRVMMIGEKVGTLIESNLLTNLNDPCAIEDVSWIKPGKTTFPWWNGIVVPDGPILPGNNLATQQYYIDFAARAGLDYHAIIGYSNQPWYEDEKMNFEFQDSTVDVTKPVGSLDMDAVAEYAASKGIGLHVWVNWKPFYARLEEALSQFEKWGVKGMMVDFMDRDDQEMIRIQEDILKASAKHKIYVQFHGSCKPSGLNRTYPNEFAREGTRNYECYKWSDNMGADLDIAIPFTRLLAGVTDYHLGGFRAVPKKDFRIQYINPLVTSTRCHMLGMYVVLECYLGMICDKPSAYEGQPGFDFLQKLPTSWDETVVPCASVMEYATIARRHGDDWYVGSINNSQKRTISFTTDFLGDGDYVAEVYCDAEDTDENPNNLVKQSIDVNKGSTMTLTLASDGGAVIHIHKRGI